MVKVKEKLKIKLFLDIWESGSTAPSFLTLALDGDEWLASCPSHVNTRETAPSTHCIGGSEGLRAGLDILEKRNFSCPYWESNLDFLVVQPVTSSLCAFTVILITLWQQNAKCQCCYKSAITHDPEPVPSTSCPY
jgi:hypothetical protein